MSSSATTTHQSSQPALALVSPPSASPTGSPTAQTRESHADTGFSPVRSQSPETTNDEGGDIADLPKPKPRGIPESSLRGARKNTPPSRRDSHVSFGEEIKPIERRVATGISAESGGSAASSTVPDAWVRQYVLSFDGGGIRGYSSLLIIQKLMEIIGEIETHGYGDTGGSNNSVEWDGPAWSSYHPQPYTAPERDPGCTSDDNGGSRAAGKRSVSESSQYLPCHYFDYIGGTSTGGLISIMLSRLRMNVDDCINEYENLADKVFGHPRVASIRGPIPALREKYDSKNLKRVVQQVVKQRLNYQPNAIAADLFSSHESMCKTIVVAYQQKTVEDGEALRGEPPFLFRSYDHRPSNPTDPIERNPGLSHRIPIWQVARATSAAPTYFDTITIDNRKFGDGGFGTNNPTWEIFWEVTQMCGGNSLDVALTVSIGTGMSPVSRYGSGMLGKYYTYLRAAKNLASESENRHEDMINFVGNGVDRYFRFNVPEGLGKMRMDEWKPIRWGERGSETLNLIKTKTRDYLSKDDVRRDLRKVARILVQNRRERSKTPKWEIVSLGTQYRCCWNGCPKSQKIRQHVGSLKSHLRKCHNVVDPAEVEKWVDKGKCQY